MKNIVKSYIIMHFELPKFGGIIGQFELFVVLYTSIAVLLLIGFDMYDFGIIFVVEYS